MTGEYSKEQQIYSLSFSTNSAYGRSFDSVPQMQEFVTNVANKVLKENKATRQFIGDDWETVWGPIVYSHNPGEFSVIADNTMGVFFSPSQKLFVIAIAGTNAKSIFDWKEEDFAVKKLVPWKSITGEGKGCISQGTHTGLDVLLHKMMDKNEKSMSMLSKLKQYISQNKISDAEVAVTGHSLGGALAPALALYMLDKRSEWDSDGMISISSYPTAGPTLGDEDFVKHYESKVKHDKSKIEKGKISYFAKYNPLDVVPKAWDKELLATIPQLYKDSIEILPRQEENTARKFIGLLAVGLTANAIVAKKYHIPYKHISPREELRGEFNKELDAKYRNDIKRLKLVLHKYLKDDNKYFSYFARFAVQAAFQHTTKYYRLLEVETFMKAYHQIITHQDSGAVRYTPEDLALQAAIGSDLKEFDLKNKNIDEETRAAYEAAQEEDDED